MIGETEYEPHGHEKPLMGATKGNLFGTMISAVHWEQ